MHFNNFTEIPLFTVTQRNPEEIWAYSLNKAIKYLAAKITQLCQWLLSSINNYLQRTQSSFSPGGFFSLDKYIYIEVSRDLS